MISAPGFISCAENIQPFRPLRKVLQGSLGIYKLNKLWISFLYVVLSECVKLLVALPFDRIKELKIFDLLISVLNKFFTHTILVSSLRIRKGCG